MDDSKIDVLSLKSFTEELFGLLNLYESLMEQK